VHPEYVRAVSIKDALDALAGGNFKLLAGGTDVYPALGAKPLRANLLDISAVPELRQIRPIADGWRIGAGATWSDVLGADLPPWFSALKAAAREIGGPQVQNLGTVAGNVCNASPAADGSVALLALDARVIVASAGAMREVSLTDFVLGARKCALAANEMVLAFDIPQRSLNARAAFAKLGHRRYLVISVAMVSVLIDCNADGIISHALVAVGALSARAIRLTELEAELIGKRRDARLALLAEPRHLARTTPIDDIRGTRVYRLDAALTLLRRALAEVLA